MEDLPRATIRDLHALGEWIHVYWPENPTQPTTFARGQIAVAEPAVPGWKITVDDVFGPPAKG